MRSPNAVFETAPRFLTHSQSVERHALLVLIQQPQHDTFAVEHGDRGHADVHGTILQAQPDASVLRHAPLRDVEVGHDFQATHDRGGKMGRRRRSVLEHAVDAIAHAQFVGIALEVHIRRARLERLEQQQVHKPDDGRFIGEMHQVVQCDVRAR